MSGWRQVAFTDARCASIRGGPADRTLAAGSNPLDDTCSDDRARKVAPLPVQAPSVRNEPSPLERPGCAAPERVGGLPA